MVRVRISRDKKKFPHQLNDSLETDIWFLCHILLVKDVTRSNRIQGVKDRLHLLLGDVVCSQSFIEGQVG